MVLIVKNHLQFLENHYIIVNVDKEDCEKI